MKNVTKSAAAKTATSKKGTSAKKENKVQDVVKMNLDKFTDRLKDFTAKEKNAKQTIYIYPETIKNINEEEGKRFRNSLRNKLKRFSHNIFAYSKTQNFEALTKEIAAFDEFYKMNYHTNDYSFASISNTKNEQKEKDVKLMIEIIAEIKAQTK